MEAVTNVLEDLCSLSVTVANVIRTYGLSSPIIMGLLDTHVSTPRSQFPRFTFLNENHVIWTDRSKNVLTLLH